MIGRVGKRPSRILLIQLHHLGDVILTTPVIRAVRQAFPEAHIDFLTGALGAQALDGNPDLNQVLIVPRARQLPYFLWRLRQARYDVVIDLHCVPRTALFVAATRAALRIGLRGHGPRNQAYTRLLVRETGPIYMPVQKLRLLTPLGLEVEQADLALKIAIDETQHRWAQQTLVDIGLADAQAIVAISPVARQPFKQWGAPRWAAVGDALAAQGAAILITSGPGEAAQAEAVAATMQHRAVWRYPRTSVRQLAALYQRCALWIGNDGGAKHIAVAAGIPTVSVVRWQLAPVWNDLRQDTRQAAFDPAPPQGCNRRCSRCLHIGCLAAVSTVQVIATALEQLNNPHAHFRANG